MGDTVVHKSFIPQLVRPPNRKRTRIKDYVASIIKEREELLNDLSMQNSFETVYCPACGSSNNFPYKSELSVFWWENPAKDFTISRDSLRAQVLSNLQSTIPLRHICFHCKCNFNTVLGCHDVYFVPGVSTRVVLCYMKSPFNDKTYRIPVSDLVFYENYVALGDGFEKFLSDIREMFKEMIPSNLQQAVSRFGSNPRSVEIVKNLTKYGDISKYG